MYCGREEGSASSSCVRRIWRSELVVLACTTVLHASMPHNRMGRG